MSFNEHTTVILSYWEPNKATAKTSAVTNAAHIEKLASGLLHTYKPTAVLPGIELQAGDGSTLSIAVSPDRWALIYTNPQFTQYCTKGAEKVSDISVDVRWEEVTAIPRSWFIPKALALAGLKQWLADGTRSPGLPWSDDCA